MIENEKKCRKTNYGLILFILSTGFILLGNLFEYLPWQLWHRGSIIVGFTIFCNLILRKKCKHLLYQFISIVLTFLLLTHTLFTIIEPNYLQTKEKNLTAFEMFHQKAELRTEYYDNIILKNLDVKIKDGKYSFTDSIENSYYFKMHPPNFPDTDAFLEHGKVGNTLEVKFVSKKYKLNPIQKFLEQNPTFVFGNFHIPVNLNLEIEQEGSIDLDFKRQKVSNFEAFFKAGKSTIKFSENSLPTDIFKITVTGGETEIYIPKERSHIVNYVLKNQGQLLFNGSRIFEERGVYDIVSSGEKNSCEINIYVESGTLNLKTF